MSDGTFVSIGAGWKKESSSGKKYLACQADREVKLYVKHDGKTYEVKYFSCFWQDKATGNQPAAKFMADLKPENVVSGGGDAEDIPF